MGLFRTMAITPLTIYLVLITSLLPVFLNHWLGYLPGHSQSSRCPPSTWLAVYAVYDWGNLILHDPAVVIQSTTAKLIAFCSNQLTTYAVIVVEIATSPLPVCVCGGGGLFLIVLLHYYFYLLWWMNINEKYKNWTIIEIKIFLLQDKIE